ncbi:MAG: hypothetical protein L0Z50_38665 [Verrucomicrobiales bacterium]|nr:hypothetical protein [Verrucomicrobiales bacterium]
MQLHQLITRLKEQGVVAYPQSDSHVVIATSNPPLPDSGGTFWLTQKASNWFVGTWSPRAYSIPADKDIVELSLALLRVSKVAVSRIPNEFAVEWQLTELSDSAASEVLAGLYDAER